MSEPQVSEDLTADDHLVENTEKDAPDSCDADLVQPIQDPLAIPASVVDEDGLDDLGELT